MCRSLSRQSGACALGVSDSVLWVSRTIGSRFVCVEALSRAAKVRGSFCVRKPSTTTPAWPGEVVQAWGRAPRSHTSARVMSEVWLKGRARGGPAGRHVRGEGVRDDLVSLEYWCALLHTKSCTLPSQCIRKRLTRSSSLVSVVWARSVLVPAKVSLSSVNGA